MKLVRTKAVVLRRTNYGEADRILQILTQNGKKCVIVKGARREKSRLAGGVELFAICEVVIREGRGDIQTLTSARLVEFFQNIIKDYDKLQFAYQVIRVISKSSEMVDEPEWYDTLVEILAGLNDEKIKLELVQIWFYLRYSSLMGYGLSLWHDIDGNKLEADSRYIYDISERGLRCCEQANVSSAHIKLLRVAESNTIKLLSQISGVDEVIDECLDVVVKHASL